MGMPIAVQIPN